MFPRVILLAAVASFLSSCSNKPDPIPAVESVPTRRIDTPETMRAYGGEIQTRLQAALKARSVPGLCFAAPLRVWINGRGEPTRAEARSGNETIDAQLVETVLMCTFSPPPLGLPMPVTLAIKATPPAGADPAIPTADALR